MYRKWLYYKACMVEWWRCDVCVLERGCCRGVDDEMSVRPSAALLVLLLRLRIRPKKVHECFQWTNVTFLNTCLCIGEWVVESVVRIGKYSYQRGEASFLIEWVRKGRRRLKALNLPHSRFTLCKVKWILTCPIHLSVGKIWKNNFFEKLFWPFTVIKIIKCVR